MRRRPVASLLRDALQTGLRLVPWPTEPGLRAIGEPGPESPVLVTGNYDLTVRHVLRCLRGLDAWLVVAPSQGINVWCAAAGGILTTSQVVTALKTSGIGERVRHRRAILPQLAATGVVATEVSRRCGWKVRFGPVYAEDIARYLAAGSKKDDSMRRVRFGAGERLQMACAWAVPTMLVAVAVLCALAPRWIAPVVLQIWVVSIAVFLAYDRILGPRRLLLWAAVVGASLLAVTAAGGAAAALVAAAVSGTVVVAVLTFDYEGSTPVEGGSHFESRNWSITLDLERCAGVYSCWAVCPEACFEKLEAVRKVELAHDERCVKCGACVVQCPQDALFFAAADGSRISPATIRRYKLNLMGRRGVDTGTSDAEVDGGAAARREAP